MAWKGFCARQEVSIVQKIANKNNNRFIISCRFIFVSDVVCRRIDCGRQQAESGADGRADALIGLAAYTVGRGQSARHGHKGGLRYSCRLLRREISVSVIGSGVIGCGDRCSRSDSRAVALAARLWSGRGYGSIFDRLCLGLYGDGRGECLCGKRSLGRVGRGVGVSQRECESHPQKYGGGRTPSKPYRRCEAVRAEMPGGHFFQFLTEGRRRRGVGRRRCQCCEQPAVGGELLGLALCG